MQQTFTATTAPQSVDLVEIRLSNARRWKLFTIILAGFSIVLILIITPIAFKLLRNDPPYESTVNTEETTNTLLLVTTNNMTISESQVGELSTSTSTSTSISTTKPLYFTPAIISDFFEYEISSGLKLNGTLYQNAMHGIPFRGYVINISFRLFYPWRGNDPLYLFVLAVFLLNFEIVYRYPFVPFRNTTEWQTIQIPSDRIPIASGNRLAIGMPHTIYINEIYAVRSTFSLTGKNISNNTIVVSPSPALTDGFYGVAFTYTILTND